MNGKEFQALLKQVLAMDPVEAVVMIETWRGHAIVRPGAAAWLRSDDWLRSTVCSVSKKEARLVLLEARKPGSGALGRLLGAVESAGLSPVILSPSARLEAHLRGRGWVHEPRGVGPMRDEVWRPRLNGEAVHA